MRNRRIAILTRWGGGFGSGHIQRMAGLLWHAYRCGGTRMYLWHDTVPDFFPAELVPLVIAQPDAAPDCIVRDMRDSTRLEIESLRALCPVCVVDDFGEGRAVADYRVDLLPAPSLPISPSDLGAADGFLYGYTFIRGLESMRGAAIAKTIDYALYPGADPDGGYVRFMVSLLPGDACHAVFQGDDSYVERNGVRKKFVADDYARVLLSSKAVISHFGITLYEARAAKCEIITINPTQYHSMLADAAPSLGIRNCGVAGSLSVEHARDVIQRTADCAPFCSVLVDDVAAEVLKHLDRIYQYLRNIA